MLKIDKFRGKYYFLSNTYPHEIEIFNKKYKSTEYAFQSMKAISEKDHEWIRNSDTWQLAKTRANNLLKIGRGRPDWHEIKNDRMYRCLEKKFEDATLRAMLLATGDAYLEEGNWWNDTYWGVCNGVGENYLGKLLMQLRSSIIMPG